MTNKEKLVKLFTDNPSQIGLCEFYDGICSSLMESGFITNSIKPFLSNYRVTPEVVSVNDEGEDYYDVYIVIKFTETFPKKYDFTTKTYTEFPDQVYYFKFYGYHRSHDGTYYTGFKEVSPTTRTIEVFE